MRSMQWMWSSVIVLGVGIVFFLSARPLMAVSLLVLAAGLWGLAVTTAARALRQIIREVWRDSPRTGRQRNCRDK